jgi:hypothetical protein
MATEEEFRSGLEDLRSKVDSYEKAIDVLLKLADSRGQGDLSVPLIVLGGDKVLVQ